MPLIVEARSVLFGPDFAASVSPTPSSSARYARVMPFTAVAPGMP
ncbi:hypothetical protein [Microbacterium sp. 1P10AE]